MLRVAVAAESLARGRAGRDGAGARRPRRRAARRRATAPGTGRARPPRGRGRGRRRRPGQVADRADPLLVEDGSHGRQRRASASRLVLTCGVIEAGQIDRGADVTQLEGGAIQLTPFEVVSATRRADVVAPPWRYVQFEYGVRLLSDGFFGQDVNIPALTVTYNFRTAGRRQHRPRPELRAAGAADARAVARAARRPATSATPPR